MRRYYLIKKINQEFYASFAEAGISLSDEVHIEPIFGKKKTKLLNRTQIDLIADHFSNKEKFIYFWELPTLKNDRSHLTLKLIYPESVEPKDDNGRFILVSNTDLPFKINGNYSYFSFLQNGDRVQMGNNILTFTHRRISGQDLNSLDEHPILSNDSFLKSDLSLLIEGQTGTGKSHLAKRIHELSKCRGEFVHLNLSALSANLLESELFGHVKGAFTGAIGDKKGAFCQSQHGTLFLDEIDSLPLEIQTKLLVFLDHKKIRAVGDSRDKVIHNRLIFASGKKLKKLVEAGLMRKDFYYRISSSMEIELNSLKDDPQKIQSICTQYALGHSIVISNRLIEFYSTLPWPGNIRQLIEHLNKKRKLSVSRKIEFDKYDEGLIENGFALKEINDCHEFDLKKIKRVCALRALHFHDGNIKKASTLLKVSPNTLRSVVGKTS